MKQTSLKLLTVCVFSFSLLSNACGTSDGSIASDDNGEFPLDSDDTASSDDGGIPNVDQPILGGGPYAVGTLKIVIEHPAAETVIYELACFGDTATLIPDSTKGVRPDRACTALAQSDIEQHLADGPDPDQRCTEQFGGPDTAAIRGILNGKDIEITVDRANGCGIDTWDVLLADVLPPALGNL